MLVRYFVVSPLGFKETETEELPDGDSAGREVCIRMPDGCDTEVLIQNLQRLIKEIRRDRAQKRFQAGGK